MTFTLQPGKKALAFNLTATDSKKYNLSDFYKFKYLVVLGYKNNSRNVS